MFQFPWRESRLIVAVDQKVDPSQSPTNQARRYLEETCVALDGLGVTLKINTIARILGADAVKFIQDRGFGCFLDLKLFDIQSTLQNDIAWIQHCNPLMLTIAEQVHTEAFRVAQSRLRETLILPVGPLTTLTDAEFTHFGEGDREQAVKLFFKRSRALGVKGVICSPRDIAYTDAEFRQEVMLITPGIRRKGVHDDNSVNARTASEAFAAGAAAIVVGRPIIEAPDMYKAAEEFLAEIPSSL